MKKAHNETLPKVSRKHIQKSMVLFLRIYGNLRFLGKTFAGRSYVWYRIPFNRRHISFYQRQVSSRLFELNNGPVAYYH